MPNNNLLFHQRQLERLWLAVRTKLGEGHALPENLLKGSRPAEWVTNSAVNKNLSYETIDGLAKWLGYADFGEFSTQNSSSDTKAIPRRIHRNYILGLLALGTVAVAAMMYIMHLKSGGAENPYNISTGNVSEQDRLAIETLIKNATEAEFTFYKSLPVVDTTGLSTNFVAASPAYKVITSNITTAVKNKWTLQNEGNASYFVLMETNVKNSDGKTAEVTTRENWYLEYFVAGSTSSIYTYNNLSTQYYQVKKVKGVWKVYLNAYPSTKQTS